MKMRKKKNKKRLSLLFLILTLSLPQGFSSGETDFYLCQFFSNFLKYSSSNFLSSQLYSNFAIYFPGSLLFLYSFALRFPFTFLPTSIFSCHLTSTFNLPLNSSTNFLAFTKFSFFFHVSYSTINPFYYTKYFSVPLTFLLFNILSISYSSSPSTFIGLASFFF